MLLEQRLAGRSKLPTRIPHSECAQASVLSTSSDSMVKDSRLTHPPIWVVRRQTEQPGFGSAKIPCFLVPANSANFPFWIQPVAAGSRNCEQQLKTVHTWSEQDEGRMAMFSLFSALLLNSAFTQDAVSMSNPEVENCR